MAEFLACFAAGYAGAGFAVLFVWLVVGYLWGYGGIPVWAWGSQGEKEKKHTGQQLLSLAQVYPFWQYTLLLTLVSAFNPLPQHYIDPSNSFGREKIPPEGLRAGRQTYPGQHTAPVGMYPTPQDVASPPELSRVKRVAGLGEVSSDATAATATLPSSADVASEVTCILMVVVDVVRGFEVLRGME